MKIKNLTILILSFTLVIFWGCEKDFTDTIDVQNNSYQVVRVNVKDSLQYPVDTSAVFRIEFNSSNEIKNVSYDIYAPDKSKLNSTPLAMLDNGNSANGDLTANDRIYSASFSLDSIQINGNYEVRYFVTDRLDKTNQVASSVYNYNNGTANVAPVISNLVLVDSTQKNILITFSVDVFDQNGAGDILKVYYELYRPDGSQVSNSQGITQFPLFDDGLTSSNGDLTANDGRYTVQLTFPTTVASGQWRFEFSAVDRGGKLSNKIIKSVVVQ